MPRKKYFWTASKRFWQTYRHIRRGKQYSTCTMYSVGGALSTEDTVGRCKEYFEDLLNSTRTSSCLSLGVRPLVPEGYGCCRAWLTHFYNVAWIFWRYFLIGRLSWGFSSSRRGCAPIQTHTPQPPWERLCHFTILIYRTGQIQLLVNKVSYLHGNKGYDAIPPLQPSGSMWNVLPARSEKSVNKQSIRIQTMGTQMTGQTGKKALAVSWTTLPTINCTLPGTDILSMQGQMSSTLCHCPYNVQWTLTCFGRCISTIVLYIKMCLFLAAICWSAK